jgi:hypothetical protein
MITKPISAGLMRYLPVEATLVPTLWPGVCYGADGGSGGVLHAIWREPINPNQRSAAPRSSPLGEDKNHR